MSGLKRLLGIAIVVGAVSTVFAAPVTIKLSTQAPTGTTWAKDLGDLAAQWNKATEGRVTLRLFPDGSQGDEASVIRKMRPEADTLQASLMTSGGLSNIDKGFNIFTVPFFFESDAEVVAVQKALEPLLEKGLQAQGFHLVSWGSGGWIEIFSKKPIKTLAELKAAKLYASQNDDVMMQWYTRNGFHPQQLPLAEIGPALKLVNGQIDTAPNNPYVALMTQIYGDAKNMLDVHVAPLVGAIIVAKRVWDPLSETDKAKMTDAARAMETKIRSEITALDASSLSAMQKKGLNVIKPDPAALAEFRSAGVDMAATLRGTIPNDVFQTASAERDRVRKLK